MFSEILLPKVALFTYIYCFTILLVKCKVHQVINFLQCLNLFQLLRLQKNWLIQLKETVEHPEAVAQYLSAIGMVDLFHTLLLMCKFVIITPLVSSSKPLITCLYVELLGLNGASLQRSGLFPRSVITGN